MGLVNFHIAARRRSECVLPASRENIYKNCCKEGKKQTNETSGLDILRASSGSLKYIFPKYTLFGPKTVQL